MEKPPEWIHETNHEKIFQIISKTSRFNLELFVLLVLQGEDINTLWRVSYFQNWDHPIDVFNLLYFKLRLEATVSLIIFLV